MSGSATGRAPRTDAELARDVMSRISKLEQPTTARVGSWVLHEDAGSNLVASKPGESFTLGAAAPAVTQLTETLVGGPEVTVNADLWTALAALIQSVTGIDLTSLGALLGGLITQNPLANLLALLNPINLLDPNFDVAAALETLLASVLSPTQWMQDLLGLIGFPTGLGTGNPVPASMEDIPLLGDVVTALENVPVIGPFVEAITGVADQGLAFLRSWFGDLLGGVLGGPGGLGTGSVDLGVLDDIPILGPVLSLFLDRLTGIGSGITGGTGLGDALGDLMALLGNPGQLGTGAATMFIPPGNVGGALGPSDIGGTAQAIVDAVAVGIGRLLGSDYSLGTLSGVAREQAEMITNNVSITNTHSLSLANRSVTKPAFNAIDPTADPVFPLSLLMAYGATGSFVPLSAGASVMGVIGIPDPGRKTALMWYGKTIANITAFVVKLYKLNPATGAMTWLHTSGEISGYLSDTADAFVFYNFEAGFVIDAAQGDWYVAEAILSGAGTYQVAGVPNVGIPAHPSLHPRKLGATRSPLATVTYGALGSGYTRNTSASTVSGSFPITVDEGDAILVAVAVLSNSSGSYAAFTRSVTCDGAAMDPLAVINAGNSTQGWLEVFGKRDLTAGTKTIAWSVTGGSPTFYCAAGNAEAFPNVASFGTPVTNAGTSTGPSSGTVASNANMRVFQAFMSGNTGSSVGAYSNYTQTLRWPIQNLVNGGNKLMAFAMGDAPGAPSLVFGVTSGASIFFGSIAVPLLPKLLPDADLAASDYTYANNTPYFAFTGVGGRVHHIDNMWFKEVVGTFRWDRSDYAWADQADLVGVGAGGGGGGGEFGSGSTGVATVFTVHYLDATPDLVITAAGGAGGPSGWQFYNAAFATGFGPGTQVYNDTEYFGGGDVPQTTPGSSPGGGGGGGMIQILASWEYGDGADAGLWATHLNLNLDNVDYIDVTIGAGGVSSGSTPGAAGAPGGAWIRSYQL